MPITRTRPPKAGPYDAPGPAVDSGARCPRVGAKVWFTKNGVR